MAILIEVATFSRLPPGRDFYMEIFGFEVPDFEWKFQNFHAARPKISSRENLLEKGN